MQPNPITLHEPSAAGREADFGEDAATRAPAHAPPRDSNVLVFQRDFAARRGRRLGLSGALTARALRTSVPFAARPARRRAAYDVCKRGVDVAGALALLVLTLPLFAAVAMLVKATAPGPVFFRHRRLGRHGKEFSCLKFRTMVADAEERLKRDERLRRQFEEAFKLKGDPRITPLGALLRRTSLDELPQLWHVLRGEMSLIGPRPIVRPELTKYSIYGDKLLSVKPGLSGLWQVCGRSDTTYPQRVMMDMHYIDHRCLSLDLKLLLLTAVAVVRKSGAC